MPEFKVWVREIGSGIYVTNNVDFETVEDAQKYGRQLLSKWCVLADFAVLPDREEFWGFVPQEVVNVHRIKGRVK